MIASTASPYKFGRSVLHAIDPAYDILNDMEQFDVLCKVANVPVPRAIEEIKNAPVLHMREMSGQIRHLCSLHREELPTFAKELGAPLELVLNVYENGRLPVVNFAAGGISTPADAALMMQLGCDGVFVGSGIFKSSDPARFAKAIVAATTHFKDAAVLADVSEGLGEAMHGLDFDRKFCSFIIIYP